MNLGHHSKQLHITNVNKVGIFKMYFIQITILSLLILSDTFALRRKSHSNNFESVLIEVAENEVKSTSSSKARRFYDIGPPPQDEPARMARYITHYSSKHNHSVPRVFNNLITQQNFTLDFRLGRSGNDFVT